LSTVFFFLLCCRPGPSAQAPPLARLPLQPRQASPYRPSTGPLSPCIHIHSLACPARPHRTGPVRSLSALHPHPLTRLPRQASRYRPVRGLSAPAPTSTHSLAPSDLPIPAQYGASQPLHPHPLTRLPRQASRYPPSTGPIGLRTIPLARPHHRPAVPPQHEAFRPPLRTLACLGRPSRPAHSSSTRGPSDRTVVRLTRNNKGMQNRPCFMAYFVQNGQSPQNSQ